MELTALKKEIHELVANSDDEEALIEVARTLETYGYWTISYRENTPDFWQKINEVTQSVAEDKGVSDEEVRELINNRSL